MKSIMSGIHKNISFVEENEDINDILVVFFVLTANCPFQNIY